MRAILLPNGRLLVPVEPGLAGDTGSEPFREIDPEHPEYGRWLALSTPGEDPRPRHGASDELRILPNVPGTGSEIAGELQSLLCPAPASNPGR
jgi:hypothetical protein